ncbi:putative serine/threonine-protein kinase [Leptomonas pyrrhocoris]|uniref:non-specific serine/threonine protein kinase n=1 Tax=Leptomonas pyrrhocoris TaxID=157538 RepID=A0A0N0VD36_LEPPY|nr:putative serine/threonine-protein kinase [Leptomonas pyrrhocoris]XP_015652997.1 putative serine/threonine-protein kinase [Leptomonas pyrrhocoris]KPA74557.1 putative serine/threonine-protein kinase [Leptomonas pyrrhocoris]KPA74558.1 putative serine/threonine-protein kinase [Leptomonas pyrrhocoris]|eukprot:XP_015652996.1 putative serine/threonine-protein kinase [Leptomonas pyrrhocoris]
MTDVGLKRPNSGNNGLPVPPSDSESAQDPLQGILGRGPECKYVKKRLLGQGSFGSAWRVEDSETGTVYAAKVMDLNNMSEKDRGFVTNEVKCLSRCNNPHIVRCEDAAEKGGHLLIVMEYADGGDLYKQIKARVASMKYFREHEVVFIFLQLCLALDHIHSNKMMHRDLKTANILLTTTGLVKLGDFGFSRQYEDSLSNAVGSTFCGTPYYLSPELWHRQPYSKKSEMWALGVVLYEVMALKRPFTGKNMDELITNICHGRCSELPARYSENLRDVCDRLLSVDSSKRPTIQELFHEPFIRTNLETLKRSVEKHNRIPNDVREAIGRCISQALLPEEVPVAAAEPAPLVGTVKRHTALRGWQPCQLNFDRRQITLRDPSGTDPEEVVPVATLTSVCPIDVMMAGEEFVFAMKNQAGKAFWFMAPDAKSYGEWLTTLQRAAP